MINTEQIDKNIEVEGVITNLAKVSQPYVVITLMKFECPNCGSILSIMQERKKIRSPNRCSCGWKGDFKEISKELREQQDFIMTTTDGEIKVYLTTKELIESFQKKRGSRLTVKGQLKDEFIKKENKGILVIIAEEILDES